MKYFLKTVKVPHQKDDADLAAGIELPAGQRIVSAIGASAPRPEDTHIELVVLIEETQLATGGWIPPKDYGKALCCNSESYEVREGC